LDFLPRPIEALCHLSKLSRRKSRMKSFEEERGFDNVEVYLTGRPRVRGTVHFGRVIYATVLYFRESSATVPNPLSSPLVVTPLSEPYQNQDGHHIFNLAFYSELTVIDGPPRLCFHDPTQELGVSLNFPSKVAFQELFNYLQDNLTIISPGLPGFFMIQRLRPPLSRDEHFKSAMQSRRSGLTQAAAARDSYDSLIAHTKFLERLTPAIGHTSDGGMRKASAEAVMAALGSRSDLRALLRQFSVPERLQWRAWLSVIGLYPVDSINDELRRQYLVAKQQWATITKSQFARSQIFRRAMSETVDSVRASTAGLLGVVNDTAIVRVAEAVMLTVVHMFQGLVKHREIVLDILKVVLWILVETVRHAPDPVFVNKEGIEYDVTTLEILAFWSVIFILEEGETRIGLQETDPKFDPTEPMADFIMLVHSALAQKIHLLGGYAPLRSVLAAHFSATLPPAKCTDVWLAASAVGSFRDFTQFMLVSCLLFNFPMISDASDLQKVVQGTAGGLISHTYLEASSFVLCERARDMVREHLPK
jgi:hypothetical protein